MSSCARQLHQNSKLGKTKKQQRGHSCNDSSAHLAVRFVKQAPESTRQALLLPCISDEETSSEKSGNSPNGSNLVRGGGYRASVF